MSNSAAVSNKAIERPMLIKTIAFVAPYLGLSLLLGPVVAVLGGIYAKHYGLALTTIAAVMLAARIFDAVTDPLIGYYSDQWRVRTGSRKPFMVVGGLLLVPCSYFLFVPPEGVGGIYFAFWYMTFYLALTIFSIPYLAWANEFTIDSKDKILVFSLINAVGMCGTALFYLIPLLPLFISSEITPEVLKVTLFMGAALFLTGLACALYIVPSGGASLQVDHSKRTFVKKPSVKQQAKDTLASLIKNKPLVLYISAYMSYGIGFGMWLGFLFVYVDIYLKLGEKFAQLSLWGMLVGALAIPFWYRLSLFLGKPHAWLLGLALLCVAFLTVNFLQPGPSTFTPLFLINMWVMFSVGSLMVITGPMLCDVIDYGRLQENVERNALYFSIQGLMLKLQFAIGGALGLAIVGWFGFDVNAGQQTALGIIGVRLSISWIPICFMVLSMFFIAKMPLTEKRMEIIRRRLKARDERAATLS